MNNSSFLNEVKALCDEHDKFIQESGEGFNIFSILNIETNELCHSSFIAELLNPKGRHDFGDTFLKLFIKEVDKNPIGKITLNTKESKVVIEEFIGNISENWEEGGRVDIVIKDNQDEVLIIENKIYAIDQKNQLVRYKKGYPHAIIFYLTPFGEDVDCYSKGDMMNSKDYFLISYEIQIVKWLEACLKEIDNKQPYQLIINQYLVLVKKLTSNSFEANLNRQVVELMSKHVSETFTIYNNLKNERDLDKYKVFTQSNIYDLKNKLFIEFMDEIEKECKNKEFEFLKNWEYDRNTDYGFYITPKNKNKIRFLFQHGDFVGFYYGIETDNTNIESDGFITYNNLLWRYWDEDPKKFGNKQEDWEDISLKENGKIFKRVFEIVDELKSI